MATGGTLRGPTPQGPESNDDDLKKEIDDEIDLIKSHYPTPQGPSHTPQYPVLSEHDQHNIKGTRTIRYGILGCAGIASKIARAIKLAPFSEITVVASRSIDKARHFVQRNCPNAEAKTYDELIQSTNIDVVYIPIPTALRLPWIIKAIEKKKHVLCEKPIGSPKWMEIIIPSCRAKKVQFMDGIEFMHHPRFKELTEKIKANTVGAIQKVVSSFSVPVPDDKNIRNQPDLEPLGVLGDLGIHNIRLSLWAFQYEPPRFVKALCHKYGKKGAIQDCSVWLFFTGDRVASFDCSYHCPLRQHAELVGQRGSINIRQFVIPNERKSSYSIHYSTLNHFDTTEHVETKEFENAVQEKEMVTKMTALALGPATEQFWPNISLMTECVLDACRRSIFKNGALVEFVKGQLWFDPSDKNKHRQRESVHMDHMSNF